METQFRKVSIKGVDFDCARFNEASYVTVASIVKHLGVNANVVHNIIGRITPYKELAVDLEKRDSQNRKQVQKCMPLATLSGLLEKIKSSKTTKGQPEIIEKANYLMTLFILLADKIHAEHVEMSNDLVAIMKAQATQREVFNERAVLSHKMRESKKLIGNYFNKYQDRINGQLELGE